MLTLYSYPNDAKKHMPYVTIVTIGFLPYTLATIRALEFHQVEGISVETPIPLMTTHAYPLDLFQCRHSHVFTRTSWVEKIIQLQQLQINTFPNISYKLYRDHGFSWIFPSITETDHFFRDQWG